MMRKNPIPRKAIRKLRHFQYPILEEHPLTLPIGIQEVPFFKTVLSRRSSNSFKSLGEARLSTLLYYTSKNIAVGSSQAGHMWAKRPAPSAGGIHPIDLIIYDPARGSSLYYYDPFKHSLNKLELAKKLVDKFIDNVYSVKPAARQKATIIWMVAHADRTNVKYLNPESLVWRDAGCLLYCLNLVAAALRIHCCSVGILGEPSISQLFRNFGDIEGVGGCLLG